MLNKTNDDDANTREGLRADQPSELALGVEGDNSVAATNVLLVYKDMSVLSSLYVVVCTY